jgi:hypothetical protein
MHSASKKALTWVLIGLAAIAVLKLYYVQEMLAALVLFAILFGSIATVLMFLFILDRASQTLLHLLEPRAKHLLKHSWR